MELKEIIKKCKTLNIYEERSITDNYYEVVFYTKDTDQWNQLFTEILGLAAKPYGVEPSQGDITLTQKYGGLREKQTLYKEEKGNVVKFAMFWPWQDEVRTTIKVVFIKK